MNKAIPIVVLCTAAIVTTIMLNGCGRAASAETKVSQPHLSTFLSLHNQYCEKKYDTHQSLQESLKVSPDLSLAKNFNGVYEILVDGISYAVSPEEDGCTTDVMLQTKDNKQLFSFEDINKALLDNGYIETGEPVSHKDMGINQEKLTVIKKHYISPKGEITTLDFPLEKKNKYYMTLFAEKFTEARRENKEKVMQTLRMASR